MHESLTHNRTLEFVFNQQQDFRLTYMRVCILGSWKVSNHLLNATAVTYELKNEWH